MARESHRQRYEVFLSLLREERVRAGLTQAQLASRLKDTQTFVSKCERGERRLDVVDLIDFIDAMGLSASSFFTDLDSKLRSTSAQKKKKP